MELLDNGTSLQLRDLSNELEAPGITGCSDEFYPLEDLSRGYVCPLTGQKVHKESIPLELAVLTVFFLEAEIVQRPELDGLWKFLTDIVKRPSWMSRPLS